MTATEQAFDVAKRFLAGSEQEREVILSCFSEEEQKTFEDFIRYYKLYSDKKYYKAIQKAVCSQLLQEIYG